MPTDRELDEPSAIYHQTTDMKGNDITVFSTTPNLRTAEEIGKAVYNYSTGKPTPGFVISPSESMQARTRRGFEQSFGTMGRDVLPQYGEQMGGYAAQATLVPTLLALAEKAGLVPPGSSTALTQAGRTTGGAVGRFAGQQIDEPAEIGMMAGTAAVAPFMAPGTQLTAKGTVSALPRLLPTAVNATLAGLGGGGGAIAARAMTGEDTPLEQGIQDFGVAALSGAASTVISTWISRYLAGDTGEKVAGGIIDSFKKRYPTISTRDDVVDIALSSRENLGRLTSQMSSGLRDTVENESKALVDTIRGSLLHRLTVGEQNTLRAYTRRLVEAQTKQLDAIGDNTAYEAAKPLIAQRQQELLGEVRRMYSTGPNKVKSIDPTIVRVEQNLAAHESQVRNFDEGAKVLHYLKLSNGDMMKFARLVQGGYKGQQGTQLDEIARILTQGGSIESLPKPGAPPSNIGGVDAVADALKGRMRPPLSWLISPSKSTTPQFPWQAPGQVISGGRAGIPPTMSPGSIPMSPLVNFTAQEGGQAAIRSFLNREEK